MAQEAYTEELVKREFSFSKSTLASMEELARIAGHKGKDRLGTLLRDVLREHEWLISHQAEGRTIIALEKKDLKVLAKSVDIAGERESLVPFFTPRRRKRVQEYFKRLPC